MPVNRIVVERSKQAQSSQDDSDALDLIWKAIERVRPCLAKYVASQFDLLSENDFTDGIARRLIAQKRSNPSILSDSSGMDEAVRNTLRLLVHERKRTVYRRGEIAISPKATDPNSLAFAEKLETESLAQAVLRRVPADMLSIIENLYGLHETEELSVKAIAANLGISENTLSQKLSRLRADLRRKLGKIS